MTLSLSWSELYLLTVGFLGLLSMLLVRALLVRAERRRKERVAQLARFDAVRTATPLDEPHKVQRRRSLESVDTTWALIRRITLPATVLFWLVVGAFPFLGQVPATVVTILAGVVSVVVGVAAKPFVENLIAGVVLAFTQPLRIGDTVEVDGQYGTVEDISTTHTTVKMWDWRRYQIPNGQLLTKEFINLSIVDRFQWAHVEFWVAPDADLDLVESLAVNAISTCEAWNRSEPPRFWVMETAPHGVRCWAAGWADSPSLAWALASGARKSLMRSLQAAGIRTHAHSLSLAELQLGRLSPLTPGEPPQTGQPQADSRAVDSLPSDSA